MEVREILRGLPHKVGQGLDWFEAATCYPLHARILGVLQPAKYVEFGAHVGYSLIAALSGAASIQQVAWADNESYIEGSNRLAAANLAHFLERAGRSVRHTVCAGVEAVAALPPGSPQRAPYERADVLYVDGDHHFEGARRDLHLAHALGARMVLVDDCLSECDPEVPRAVEAFGRETGYPVGLVLTFRGMAVLDFTVPPGGARPPVMARLAQAGIPVREPEVEGG